MPANICPVCGYLNTEPGPRHARCQQAYRQDAYGPGYRAARKRMIEDDPDARCAVCSSTLDLQLDHVVAVRGGRRRNTGQYVVLCRVHNRRKGDA